MIQICYLHPRMDTLNVYYNPLISSNDSFSTMIMLLSCVFRIPLCWHHGFQIPWHDRHESPNAITNENIFLTNRLQVFCSVRLCVANTSVCVPLQDHAGSESQHTNELLAWCKYIWWKNIFVMEKKHIEFRIVSSWRHYIITSKYFPMCIWIPHYTV
jgi:hypothetical protein